MNTATFIAAAGVDPYALADEIITARPAEVSALADAFLLAAEALGETGSLSGLAGELADASASFDGAAPTDLMLEVSAVQASLNAGPSQLAAIGGPLSELAAQIATAQLKVGDVLAAMEEQCVAVALDYASWTPSILTEGLDLEGQYAAKGAAVVLAAHQQIVAVTDAHDAFVDSILLSLQDADYLIPPDVDAAVTDTVAGTGSAAFPVIPTSTPAATAQWWAGLSPAEQAQLIQDHPTVLASTPGLPATVYDLINRRGLADSSIDLELEIEQNLADLVASGTLTDQIKDALQIDDPSEILTMSPEDLLLLAGLVGPMGNHFVIGIRDLIASRTKIHGTQQSIADQPQGEQRYLLEYDFGAYDGDGAAIIAIGEVDTADNVAVVVQGATHDLYSIEGQTADAGAVIEQMADVGGDDTNAVIVYAGYDNPTVLQSPFPGRAEDGGELLIDDLAGWDAAHTQTTGTDAHTTVIAHSYGTVMTSEALQNGATEYVDDVVVLGSPGMGVDSVADLGLPGDHVFAGMDDDDILLKAELIEDVLAPDPIPGVDFNVVHGPSTTTEEFGATVIATGGVDHHGDYFSYENGKPVDTLITAAAVATGEYDEVVTA